MIFSNIFFMFRFLVVVLLIYYIVPYKYKNGVITIASLIFYSWGEVKYFPIMIASTVVDFFSSQYIERNRGDIKKMRRGLACSMIFNLGCLIFFKYTDFFISNINNFAGTSIPLLRIPLPLGISFYTFQTMSYTIDVYRGKVPAEKNIINFSAFVTMFPQLIAGPIVLYSNINEKLNTHEGRITLEGINEGIKLFIFGLGKKVLYHFSSVAQSCPTLCDPMNCSTPGLPVHHQLPEFTRTLVHRVRDAIQPSHPLSAPSPPAPNPSQRQNLFQ